VGTVAGLDCGGTTIRVLAVDAENRPLFQGQAGPGNLSSTPLAKLQTHLTKATAGCPNVDAVCGCFAGLVDPVTQALGLQLLAEHFPGAAVAALPDYVATVAAAESDRNACLICGTGSLVASRVGAQWVKSGGDGYLLGDEGSGFAMGRAALRLYVRHPDRAGEKLRAAVVSAFQEATPGEIVRQIHASHAPAPLIARFAGPLGQDAANGHPDSAEQIAIALRELAAVVGRHADRVLQPGEPLRLELAGGLWKASSYFQPALVQALGLCLGSRPFDVERASQPAVYGAVRLAWELLHGN
jgi:N-acetylglucosamine kinase-like BadF-type ATPase